MFLSNGKVVRTARIKDGGKTGRIRHEFPLLNFREAHPDDDLLRLDQLFLVPNNDDRPLVEEGEAPKNGSHAERPVEENPLDVGPLARVEFEFIG